MIVLDTAIELEFKINEFIEVNNFTKIENTEKELAINGWFLIGICALSAIFLIVIVLAIYFCVKLYYKTKKAEKNTKYMQS